MLTNGLGELLVEEVPKHQRFIDLFTGSAAVAWHVARNFEIETHAYDLQLYGSTLAAAVLCRTHVLDATVCWDNWKRRAARRLAKLQPPEHEKLSAREVRHARRWCEDAPDSLVRAYGGHYFSPHQICWISALRSTLPADRVEHDACLAALVMASSKCAAAPGHTAQPFQPTPTAMKYLGLSWKRDLLADVKSALLAVSARHAKVSGKASVGEANTVASTLAPGDLVCVDPPYSALQYSRFYHVLEAIAAGSAAPVSGIGRYPPRSARPYLSL
jgi:adenine-specific DNA methylase